ncbi:MAG: glutamine-hydrolyzing carbamoyl-phosphate synthase small subunit [Candidatus Mycalebacterium zealandia]|nr:MAG: glutamine-hydrolyzing carbamoyl-phosphate synthase small subunit [Candidatus Mycalebacterium zealandia]
MSGKCFLVFEDGTIFEGGHFGASGESFGEAVFNTSMTGYQEILTDPSYNGQIITMTYPEIGNYGVNTEDSESEKPFAKGLVVREYWETPSNWRSVMPLGEYMEKHGIVGIHGVDTREITRKIRTGGAQKCVISSNGGDPETLVEKVKKSPGIVGRDLVTEVSCEKPYEWTGGNGGWRISAAGKAPVADWKPAVVAYDFGIKSAILRNLTDMGCRVTVVPAQTSPAEVMTFEPDGVFLSNGPGDPEAVEYAAKNINGLLGKIPVFGICLGHQIISLALGGKTFKMKFGHRGGNQPVKELSSGKVEITSQNHGFAVDPDSLGNGTEITHVNLNDGTVEGLENREKSVFAVQYHPESSPGPHDSSYLFEKFISVMKSGKK